MSQTQKTATGPRTTKGKSRSSRNSRKHGLYSSELELTKSEMLEFADLRSGLQARLKPNTEIKALVFDDVISCAWRLKLALRLEQICIKKSFQANADKPPTQATQASSGWTLHSRLKLIKDLRERTTHGEVIADSVELKDLITGAFGEDVAKILSVCTTRDRAGWALLDAMRKKCATFHMEPPAALSELEKEAESTLLLAPDTYGLLVSALLDYICRNLLQDGTEYRGVSEEIQRVELFLRYYVKARRDFYQALKEYGALK